MAPLFTAGAQALQAYAVNPDAERAETAEHVRQ